MEVNALQPFPSTMDVHLLQTDRILVITMVTKMGHFILNERKEASSLRPVVGLPASRLTAGRRLG